VLFNISLYIYNSINQSINQSLFVSGNKNPYYLGLKESKIERTYTYKHANAKKPQTE